MSFLRRLFGQEQAPPASRAPVPNVLSEPALPEARRPGDIRTIREALDAIGAARAGFAIVKADEARNYYVQVAADATRGLHAEAVADTYLREPDRLGGAGAAKLRELGWVLDGSGSGNWAREYPGFPHDGSSGEIEGLLTDTLESVYGWTRGGPLAIETSD